MKVYKSIREDCISRKKAAWFIRSLRAAIRRDGDMYVRGELNSLPSQDSRLGMINGILILFDNVYYFPEWITNASYWRKKKEALRENPVADAMVRP